MICKFCSVEIVDEGDKYIVKPYLENPNDPSSEMLIDYAHLDCYLRAILNLLEIPINSRLEWWINNP